MFLCEVMFTPTSQLQTDKVIGGAAAETKHIAMQPMPKANNSAWSQTGRKFHRQWTMAATGDVLAQLLFVWREDANAASCKCRKSNWATNTSPHRREDN